LCEEKRVMKSGRNKVCNASLHILPITHGRMACYLKDRPLLPHPPVTHLPPACYPQVDDGGRTTMIVASNGGQPHLRPSYETCRAVVTRRWRIRTSTRKTKTGSRPPHGGCLPQTPRYHMRGSRGSFSTEDFSPPLNPVLASIPLPLPRLTAGWEISNHSWNARIETEVRRGFRPARESSAEHVECCP
jgi:hypothetical protein